MGHSQGNDVTSGYQDMYPLEIWFRNNSKLLNIEKEEGPIDIDSLTPEQMKELLKKMMGQNKNRNALWFLRIILAIHSK